MKHAEGLTAEQTERYADVLLWGLRTSRTRPFKVGDIVTLRFDHAALPLAEVVYGRPSGQETACNSAHDTDVTHGI